MTRTATVTMRGNGTGHGDVDIFGRKRGGRVSRALALRKSHLPLGINHIRFLSGTPSPTLPGRDAASRRCTFQPGPAARTSSGCLLRGKLPLLVDLPGYLGTTGQDGSRGGLLAGKSTPPVHTPGFSLHLFPTFPDLYQSLKKSPLEVRVRGRFVPVRLQLFPPRDGTARER